MCLQDLRIARRINVRVFSILTVTNVPTAIPNNPDRYGLSMIPPDARSFVVLSNLGAQAPVPQIPIGVINEGEGYQTDLRLFPGLNNCSLYVGSMVAVTTINFVEQYYDRELSLLVQGDV